MKTVFVAGHRGLAGTARLRALSPLADVKLVTASHSELDLKDRTATLAFFKEHRPDHQGEIQMDATKPDGTPRKLLDVSKMAALGWTAQTSLSDGLARAYEDFVANHA